MNGDDDDDDDDDRTPYFISSSCYMVEQDVFLSLLRSFHAAHSQILIEGGLLTTLTAAVVAQIDAAPSADHRQLPLYTGDQAAADNKRKFAVCVCNVGDSLAYVYSAKYGVREVTQGEQQSIGIIAAVAGAVYENQYLHVK